MPVTVKRKDVRFYPNNKRVITRFFMPDSQDQTRALIGKVAHMTAQESRNVFNQILRSFSHRHRNLTRILERSYNNLRDIITSLNIDPNGLSLEKKLIIGSYFTAEYSIESAAFFNPSIVEDPYQGNLQNGEKRVIVSFRAVGEGHISSIAFRNGIIDANNDLTFDEPGSLVDIPDAVTRYVYNKKAFLDKLHDMSIKKDVVPLVMDQLGEHFLYGELQRAIENTIRNQELSYTRKEVIQAINWLATSHYEVTFSYDTAIADRVLYPISYAESNGIEDARFVRLIDDNGDITYYATYTAFNGFAVLPKLIETKDFYHFKIRPIHGEKAQQKGLAIFPRKINGQYALVARIDGANNYVMYSNDIHIWNHPQKIHEPEQDWELVKVGNCGSPIETEHGWLLITHGIGPMRTYSLGAVLLDLDDPTKVIGKLKTPLLSPNDEEREGYVPNVVYSCGATIHNGELIIPYAMADYCSAFATVPLDELLAEITSNP